MYDSSHMRRKFPVTLSLNQDLIDHIDSIRHLIPRSAFIEKILLEEFTDE